MDDHWCFRLRSLAPIHFAQLDPLLSSWMSSPSDCFQDFPVLANLASEQANGTFAHSDSRQQHRRLGVGEPRPDRRFQVLKHRSPLLRASRDHCPDPFAPAVPRLTPCPLRDQAVDHHEPDRLLRQVVRRLHSRGRDEPEIALPVLLEPLRKVATVVTSPARRAWHIAALRPAPPQAGFGTAWPSVAPGGGSPQRAHATPRATSSHTPVPSRRAAS